MKKINNEYIYLGIVFIFFLLVGILIPYTGDDWNNLLFNGSLKSIIKISVNNYNSFEGRFFSRLFDLIFNYYKPIWIIINAFGMTLLYYFINKMVNVRKLSFLSALIIESLLLVDEETFSQVYVWITGNTTYFIPMIFLVFIIYINRQIFDNKKTAISYKKYMYIVLPILSFISCMFVENVAVGIISTFILIIVYYYIKNKKVNVLMVICTLSACLGLYLMLFSPGTMNRLNSMSSFDKMNLLEKIKYTFPRQLRYVFVKNSFLILISTFSSLVLIYRNLKGFKKFALYFFMGIVPFITIVLNTCYLIFNFQIGRLNFLLDCYNIFTFLYWCAYLVILIILVVKYSKADKQKLLFFFLIAILNNGAMLISPLAGGRTSFLSTIMLIICSLLIFDSLNVKIFDRKWVIKLNDCFVAILIGFFTLFYMYCYKLDLKRTIYIRNQLKDNTEVIEIIRVPGKYLWNANPYDDYHLYTFKLWYGIPQNKKVVFKNIRECDL